MARTLPAFSQRQEDRGFARSLLASAGNLFQFTLPSPRGTEISPLASTEEGRLLCGGTIFRFPLRASTNHHEQCPDHAIDSPNEKCRLCSWHQPLCAHGVTIGELDGTLHSLGEQVSRQSQCTDMLHYL